MKERYDLLKEDSAACREEAKKLMSLSRPTVEEQEWGIRFLTRAAKLQDAEALYLMGKAFLEHRLKPLQGGYLENGMSLIQKASALGYGPARIYLERDYRQTADQAPDTLCVSASGRYDFAAVRALAIVSTYGKRDPQKSFIGDLIWGAFLLVALVIGFFRKESLSFSFAICTAIYWLTILYFRFIYPKVLYRRMKKSDCHKKEYVFLEDRVRIQYSAEGIYSDGSVDYTCLLAARETGRYLFLWQGRNRVLIVDKQTFRGGMPDALRDRLKKILKKKYVISNY